MQDNIHYIYNNYMIYTTISIIYIYHIHNNIHYIHMIYAQQYPLYTYAKRYPLYTYIICKTIYILSIRTASHRKPYPLYTLYPQQLYDM